MALSRGLFRTRMYTSARELWEGLSRSAFEGAGSSVASILAGVSGGIVLSVLPWVSALALLLRDLALGRSPASGPALVLALTGCAVSASVYLPALILLRVSPLYVFTLPLATLFYSGVALDSALTSIFGSGVSWKGRRYKPDAPERHPL